MDLPKYRSLEDKHRLQVWRQLEETEGWEVFQSLLKEKISSPLRITNRDSKEAFLYEAIRSQAFQEALDLVRAHIHQLEVNQRQQAR